MLGENRHRARCLVRCLVWMRSRGNQHQPELPANDLARSAGPRSKAMAAKGYVLINQRCEVARVMEYSSPQGQIWQGDITEAVRTCVEIIFELHHRQNSGGPRSGLELRLVPSARPNYESLPPVGRRGQIDADPEFHGFLTCQRPV